MATASVALEDVASVDIMTELLRRFKCSSKPDKRLVLIGLYLPLFPYLLKILNYTSFLSLMWSFRCLVQAKVWFF